MKKGLLIIGGILLVFLLLVALFVAVLFGFRVEGSNELLNSRWKAVELNGEEIDEEVLLTSEYGWVSFRICNDVSYGKIEITDDEISFHAEPASTKMGCEEKIMDLESKFIKIFDEPAKYVVKGDRLILTAGEDEVAFVASDLLSVEPNSNAGVRELRFEDHVLSMKFSENRNDVIADSFTDVLAVAEIEDSKKNLKESDLIASLYDGKSKPTTLFYMGGDRDTYYQLLPGFYRKVFMTSKIDDLSNKNTKCTITDLNLSTKFKAQDCKTTIVNKETQIKSDSRIQHCYVPVDKNLYLAYVQVGNVVDGDYDLCSELFNAGLQSAKLQTEEEAVGLSEIEVSRRKAIEREYPDFVFDYAAQPCTAGCSIEKVEDGNDHYYAYLTHGSGVAIVSATCFRVDQDMRVYKIGEFPNKTDSYMGYDDVDPKTCRGIK